MMLLPLPLAAAALSPSASYACVLPITETRFSSGGVVIRCVLSPFRQLRSLNRGGSVAEWLARWTQAQYGPGSNRSRDAVG